MAKIQERYSNSRALQCTRTVAIDQPTLRPDLDASSHVSLYVMHQTITLCYLSTLMTSAGRSVCAI